MTILIKQLTFDDFETLALLEKEIPEFESLFSKDRLIETIGGRDYFASVALHQDTLKSMGYMIAYDRYDDGSFYCFISAVLPDYRSLGVYRKMANARELYAKENGYSSLKIKTRNRFRSMLAFLVKDGWLFEAVETDGLPEEDYKICAYKTL